METVKAKTLLTRNKSTSWFGCEYNMNIYRGCCHGCLYCDSRSHCYQIDRFDTVRTKENALAILRDQLARKVKSGVVATGAMSDPYNPHEAEQCLTRHALELLAAYGFGAAIATKSNLICRDIDVLKEVAAQSPVLCKLTITTPRDALAQKLEPGAPPSSKRFAALEQLSAAGLFCGVLLMPVMPFLEDDAADITELIDRSHNAGARFIYPAFGLTMRSGQREYLLAGLDAAFPGENLAQRYQKRYGTRYYCSSPRAKQLWQLFCAECDKRGLLYEMRDIVRAYRQGKEITQLSFGDL